MAQYKGGQESEADRQDFRRKRDSQAGPVEAVYRPMGEGLIGRLDWFRLVSKFENEVHRTHPEHGVTKSYPSTPRNVGRSSRPL